MDSPRAAVRALLALAGAVLIIGVIVTIRPSLVKKSSRPSSTPAVTYSPATSVPTSSAPTAPPASGTTAPATVIPTTVVPTTVVPTTVVRTTAPATTKPSTAPASISAPTTGITTPQAIIAAGKSPGALARTGISTDPIYLVALMLILVGTMTVWMEERLRLLGLIGTPTPGPGRARYRPQHARRRR
jgi:hypothetical protein